MPRVRKCCKQKMEQWGHHDKSTGRTSLVFKCQKCERERPLYSRYRLWEVVDRNALVDEFFITPWWYGSIGNWPRAWMNGEIVFMVIPFNKIINGVLRFWQWCRYSNASRWNSALKNAYREGERNGIH